MDPDFWHQKWKSNEIGFHQDAANALLVKHVGRLALAKGDRVFLPLCGKTLDIHWLLGNGYRVAGAELSQLAVEQLFEELGTEPAITHHGDLDRYSAEGIDIFVGDIFGLDAETLGPIDAVYDRAALVALPRDMRSLYATHLMRMSSHAPQLLICFEYDQARMQGPPFSIDAGEVTRHYGDDYALTLLERIEVPGGLKGECAMESVWLLEQA